jgi:erythromycin 3''-O-methyltransferase
MDIVKPINIAPISNIVSKHTFISLLYYIQKQIFTLIKTILVTIIFGILLFMSSLYCMFLYFKKYYNKYTDLIHILKDVQNTNNNFMNYGYWNTANMTLLEANKELCEYIYQIGEMKNSKKILDVGCGYAEQDIYWSSKTEGNIQCIDLDNNIISDAKKNITEKNLDKKIYACVGNACNLTFGNEMFDTVISLESAFHYKPRIKFLQEAYRVLEKDGKLVIADILINNKKVSILNALSRLGFINIFDIPVENQITKEEYITQLTGIGFKVELHDITEYTFKPYYKYFFRNAKSLSYNIKNMVARGFDIFLNNLCNGTDGFRYIVAVCKK